MMLQYNYTISARRRKCIGALTSAKCFVGPGVFVVKGWQHTAFRKSRIRLFLAICVTRGLRALTLFWKGYQQTVPWVIESNLTEDELPIWKRIKRGRWSIYRKRTNPYQLIQFRHTSYDQLVCVC